MSAPLGRDATHPCSVSALVECGRAALDQLGACWVVGEVFEYRGPHGSGHHYFKLRDEGASLSVILWRGVAARVLQQPLVEGQRLLVRGKFDIYPQRGSLSFLIEHLEAVGAGDLAARFERDKQRLRQEGCFDQARKRPLPRRPRRIVVICGAASAAEADILRTLHALPAPLEILLAPAPVQGRGAAEALAAQLARAATVAPDLILLARGGGSLEDLWAFNEEVLVRAVVASPVPVISAVGHESDTTLCDLAADHRAITPTDGAATVVEGWRELFDLLAELGARLERSVRQQLQRPQRPLARLHQRLREQSPERRLARLRHRLAEAEGRLWQGGHAPLRRARQGLERRLAGLQRHSPEHAVRARRHRLEQAQLRLQGADPMALLARGYALVERRDPSQENTPHYLRHIAEAPSGSPLRIHLADGAVEATVD